MDCEWQFIVIHIQRLLLPVKWKKNGLWKQKILSDTLKKGCNHPKISRCGLTIQWCIRKMQMEWNSEDQSDLRLQFTQTCLSEYWGSLWFFVSMLHRLFCSCKLDESICHNRGVWFILFLLFEPRHEKTCLRGLWPGKTQTGLHSHRC